MKRTIFTIAATLVVTLSALMLCHLCRRQPAPHVEYRDSTVYNIIYRDSTIYSIQRRDSLIVDYTLVPHTELRIDTVRDTFLVYVPMRWYHYSDSMADIYASGYNVSIDSITYHFREVTKKVTERVIVKPRKIGIDAGIALYKSSYWCIDADVNVSLRLNDAWKIEGFVGLISDGNALNPYVGAGVRRNIW